jgi:hypothetical protein
MSLPETALSAPTSTAIRSVNWDLIERVVKFGTGFVALVYAAGFLVVSVHHGKYGVVMFEFLRARVFAAGLLFAVFLLIPIVAASRVFALFGLRTMGGTRYLKSENIKFARVNSIAQFSLLAFGLASGAQVIFVSEAGAALPATKTDAIWFLLLMIATAPMLLIGDKWFDTHPKTIAAINLSALLGFLFALQKMRGHQFSGVTYWFFGVGVGFLFLHWITTGNAETVRRINWEGWFFSLLSLVLIFTTTIYGQVKPAWGGGAVAPIAVHFARPTQFSPTSDVAAFLIDETDKGFYLTHKMDDHKGTFVPREAIASIDFEELK